MSVGLIIGAVYNDLVNTDRRILLHSILRHNKFPKFIICDNRQTDG